MTPVASGLALALNLFILLVLLSSTILARPFTDEQLLEKFVDDRSEFARQPVAYSKFDDTDTAPFRPSMKRQLQSFADSSSGIGGKMKAMRMLRAMINFRRY